MMNGFLLIDKAKGINSFKLVVALRKRSGQKKVGFAGTLDPLATGLMILALGEYTKLLSYLESEDKVYQATIRLDGHSDTYDAEGTIIKVDLNSITKPSLEIVSKIIEQRFLGKISQIPPRFSAIHVNGERAYDLARAGEIFELKARPVEIFSIKILQYSFPVLKLEIHCSSGTYIRSLAHDLGLELQTGGYIEELRRTKIAKITVENAVNLDEITSENLSNFLIQGDDFLALDKVILTDQEYEVLAKGNFVEKKGDLVVKFLTESFLGIYKNQLVGILEICEEGKSWKFKKKLNIF